MGTLSLNRNLLPDSPALEIERPRKKDGGRLGARYKGAYRRILSAESHGPSDTLHHIAGNIPPDRRVRHAG